MNCFLDLRLPARKLWKNLDLLGMKDTIDNNIVFAPDELNFFFTSPLANQSGDSNALQRRQLTSDFSFANTDDLEVFNAINQIKSNAIGMDEIPMKFIRLILPQTLSHTSLTLSCFSATWKTSKIIPFAKKSNPSALSDYRPISILPALSKALKVIMIKHITEYVDNF
jgi:hypothetical protein